MWIVLAQCRDNWWAFFGVGGGGCNGSEVSQRMGSSDYHAK